MPRSSVLEVNIEECLALYLFKIRQIVPPGEHRAQLSKIAIDSLWAASNSGSDVQGFYHEILSIQPDIEDRVLEIEQLFEADLAGAA